MLAMLCVCVCVCVCVCTCVCVCVCVHMCVCVCVCVCFAPIMKLLDLYDIAYCSPVISNVLLEDTESLRPVKFSLVRIHNT